jgi:hypothetical protein
MTTQRAIIPAKAGIRPEQRNRTPAFAWVTN